MVLSYTVRVICLTLCSVGLLQSLLECIAWRIASLLARQTDTGNARRVEWLLFLLALFARIIPWVIVLTVWVPAYMRAEDNPAGERVSLLCCTDAVVAAAWSLLCCLRAVKAWLAGWRLRRQCGVFSEDQGGVPVALYPGARPVVAVAGVLRQQIIVSESMLAPEQFSAASVNLALRHESAHVRHHDNLRLLVLTLLPHLPLATPTRLSVTQQWRLVTEMAADEEGVAGSPHESLLLAELLVRMARDSNRFMPEGSFALLGRSEDLRARVERLLRVPLQQENCASMARQTAAVLASGVIIFCLFCFLFRQIGHQAAEALLHLG